MEGGKKVVVKFLDGTILKGYTTDFYKSKPYFSMKLKENGRNKDVRFSELKAVFFVKTFEGRRDSRKLRHVPCCSPQGKLGVVRFVDDEQVEGNLQGFKPEDNVIFMLPENPTGNNERIFCNAEAIKAIKWADGGVVTGAEMEKERKAKPNLSWTTQEEQFKSKADKKPKKKFNIDDYL